MTRGMMPSLIKLGIMGGFFKNFLTLNSTNVISAFNFISLSTLNNDRQVVYFDQILGAWLLCI